MQLEFKESEHGLGVQLEAQILELLQQRTLRRQQRRGDPTGRIAADFLAALQSGTGADLCGRKLTARAPKVRTFGQCADLERRKELVPNDDPTRRQAALNLHGRAPTAGGPPSPAAPLRVSGRA